MGNYFRDYTKKPVTAAQYTMMRGVTDFTNAEQLNMFEGGHSMIVIIDKPKFIEKLAEEDASVKALLENFCNIIEYEFRGLNGIEDITSEELVYTDGISELAAIGKVTEQGNSEVTMQVTEKSGATVTKFIKYYLSGVRDPRSQIKTYHGLIAEGKIAMGFENEVFNLLYLVTDASGLALEAAYLLANAYPTTARTGELFNTEKGNIENKTIDITFKCFVLQNEEIDKRAVKMLARLSQDGAVANAAKKIGNTESAALAGEVKTYDQYQFNYDSRKFNYKGIAKIDKKLQ